MPFVTEEMWSWRDKYSIHKAPWPDKSEVAPLKPPENERSLPVATEALSLARAMKTENKVSLRTPFVKWEYKGCEENIPSLKPVMDYVKNASATMINPVLSAANDMPGGEDLYIQRYT